ncbi:MAG TPA: alkaline phosphatase family protein [Deinococcales bacterium]|nr:alkaline phosphatase family protein [Deinococcales bacterium]
MNKTVVINVVGLTPRLLERAPRLRDWAAAGGKAGIDAATPAVTCTAQATYLTGKTPSDHGIVANGWYFRDECEIRFWRQSNKLVQAPKVWEVAREATPAFSSANLFWWYAMYSGTDVTVTPRPLYPADGRKLPDVWTDPPNLRRILQEKLGTFPLFNYWGPNSGIQSSRWIAGATQIVDAAYDPTLTLVYLPHLDYSLQKHGPESPLIDAEVLAIDEVARDLVRHYEERGARVILLSEYGITPARRPVHPNRVLRSQGLITLREELDRELLDAGASAAFAVADHQVAHVYVNDRSKLGLVRSLFENTPGVERVLDDDGKRAAGLDHERAGDLVLIAEPDSWFTYYYWVDDARAPDFARTVDIHRKPGFDPVELYLDPTIRNPKLKVGSILARKTLGFRYLMDVIPLDATLVRGTHGRPTDDPSEGPLLLTNEPQLLTSDRLAATDVFATILAHLGIEPQAPDPLEEQPDLALA